MTMRTDDHVDIKDNYDDHDDRNYHEDHDDYGDCDGHDDHEYHDNHDDHDDRGYYDNHSGHFDNDYLVVRRYLVVKHHMVIECYPKINQDLVIKHCPVKSNYGANKFGIMIKCYLIIETKEVVRNSSL